MSQPPITAAAAELCNQLIADPAIDSDRKSLARQLLAFVEAVRAERRCDPFYVDCIRSLAADIAGSPV